MTKYCDGTKIRVGGLYNKHWHFELRKTRHGFNYSQMIQRNTYGPSYWRHLTFGPPFSMRLVPKQWFTDQNFSDFIVQCQRDKDTLYKYMYKKKIMFYTFTKANTMNIVCIYQNTWSRWVQLYFGEIARLLDNDGAFGWHSSWKLRL